KLNPVVLEHSKFDVTDEYPRAEVEEYRQQVESNEIKPAIVVEAEYTLDQDEIKSVEAIYGDGVPTSPTIRRSKGYEDRLLVEVDADEAAAVKGLVQGHKIPDEVAKDALACKDLKGLKDYLDTDGQKRQESYTTAKATADALTDPDAQK